MISKLSREISSAFEKLKWFVSLVVERIKIEMAIIKIIGKSEKYEKEKREILNRIGERVVDLSQRKNPSVLDDIDIKDALSQLEKLDKEINLLKKEAEDISTLEA